MTKKKEEKALTGDEIVFAGMDKGHEMMEEALELAETEEQLSEQMLFIKGVALGIMANIMINEAIEVDGDNVVSIDATKAQDCLNNLQNEVRFVYEHMLKDVSEFDKAEPKGMKH